MPAGSPQRQFLIYAAIGVASNAALYGGYLLLTTFGVGHKLAMSLLFCAGVLLTFVFNRRLTFGHRGDVARSGVRYFLAYVLAYVANMLALLVFVDALTSHIVRWCSCRSWRPLV